jgi:hypothetical protein
MGIPFFKGKYSEGLGFLFSEYFCKKLLCVNLAGSDALKDPGGRKMKTAKLIFIMVLLISLLAIYGKAEAISPPSIPTTDRTDASIPPVEQALVPEGVFAIQLVEALKLGQAQDEAQAESMLSSAGIEPKNGWIAGYPVTPPIIDEIEKGVISAAGAGKLKMGKDEAQNALQSLKIKLGLNVTPSANAQPAASQTAPRGGAGNTVIYKYTDKEGVIHFTDRYESIPKEYRDRVEMMQGPVRPQVSAGPVDEITPPQGNYDIPNPGPEVITNYYYDYGPPVVTYYPPPEPYGYLYAWVPYPFWCSGFYYPGFFILHDFHRHVFFHKKPFVVTNHVAGKNGTHIVDPGSRTLQGSMGSNRVTSQRAFHSPGVQSSARTIVGLTQKRTAPATVPTPSRMTKAAPSPSMGRPQGTNRPSQRTPNESARQPGNQFQAPRMAEGRTFNPPAASGRFVQSAPPRYSSPPAAVSGRFSNSAPPRVSSPPAVSQSHILSAPAHTSGGSFGGFHQNGVFGGHSSFFGGGGRGSR